jgi:hypothetical protein
VALHSVAGKVTGVGLIRLRLAGLLVAGLLAVELETGVLAAALRLTGPALVGAAGCGAELLAGRLVLLFLAAVLAEPSQPAVASSSRPETAYSRYRNM